MTVKEYLEKLQEVINQDPSVLDLPVVYSKDDEGNQFNLVQYNPTMGKWIVGDEEIHAICIN